MFPRLSQRALETAPKHCIHFPPHMPSWETCGKVERRAIGALLNPRLPKLQSVSSEKKLAAMCWRQTFLDMAMA